MLSPTKSGQVMSLLRNPSSGDIDTIVRHIEPPRYEHRASPNDVRLVHVNMTGSIVSVASKKILAGCMKHVSIDFPDEPSRVAIGQMHEENKQVAEKAQIERQLESVSRRRHTNR
jgi:hypothetical protein